MSNIKFSKVPKLLLAFEQSLLDVWNICLHSV